MAAAAHGVPTIGSLLALSLIGKTNAYRLNAQPSYPSGGLVSAYLSG
tara:strand:- start:33 stop:173 length:141 start_codon:yes stop_codon:yes gene_type:complete